MAENEVKNEKPTIHMSIWFILFLVYLIFSLAYIFSLNGKIEALNVQLEEERASKNSMQDTKDSLIKDLQAVLDKYMVEANENNQNTPTQVTVELGTYTGSFVPAEEGATTRTMVLTLSEDNIASLSISNESGDTALTGTYTLADNTVMFTSDDGLTTYSFTAFENGTLQYVDETMTITLVR